MEANEIVEGLAGFAGRGAGTDAERRAAAWLATELSGDGLQPAVESFWCRPNWALAHALHAALAIAGGLVSLASATAGIAVLAITLASIVADALAAVSIGRLLTPEHASQNVVVSSVRDMENEKPACMILTANYDAGRSGLIYRDWLRRPVASLRKMLRANTPGWIGWLAIGTAWLLAIAALRLQGHPSRMIGVAQLPATVGLLIGFALLLDQAWSTAARDEAAGVAVAVAIALALQTMPPQHLDVELVLTGAGDGAQLGLRRHLRARRSERTATNTVVLGFAACGAGTPHWWLSDGALFPVRYARPLRDLAKQIAAEEPHLRISAHKGRGGTAALPARIAGIPAITLGCLDELGLPARMQRPPDRSSTPSGDALDAALQFALLMVDAIDTAVGELRERPAAAAA